MPRLALLVAAVIAACHLVGCTLLSPADPRLCSAAQNLSAAMAMTATAIAADEHGDLAQAQGLATQARTLTELASAQLEAMPSDKQPQPAWQALSEAYTQAARAANSLLPAYSGTHGHGRQELDLATASIARARAELPAMCFDIPADVETPGSS